MHAHVRTEFPRPVRCIPHTWIPMPDGVRLSARIWLPEDAGDDPVPAILEYIPYRKNDATAMRDSTMHPWFAGHGYAAVRVDIRGSGDSEGVLEDEYLERELLDGEEIIRWLAAQPWCTGKVGMIGISWGGFNGLMLAGRNVSGLEAVITACSTDDRYADDVHFMGGCMLLDNVSWASTMFGFNSLPPDPDVVGDSWRDMWKGRLEGSGLWLDKWMRHQHRDGYWKHGSVCEDIGKLSCPVMAVSGWADGYSNTVFRLLETLPGPRLGLVGPWSHTYPHLGRPGPAIGFLQEALRFWDKWLKGIETGIMNEPMLRVWMQDPAEPSPAYDLRSGHWVGENSWPSPRIEKQTWVLDQARLVPENRAGNIAPGAFTVQSPLSVGMFGGKWCSYSATPDLPFDQRFEDGGALVFDSDPLCEDMQILGAPVAELTLSADRPVAMVAVRLSAISENGGVTRITYGLLNLTHRNSHEHPEPLEPGTPYTVRIAMNEAGQTFRAGQRLRLAVSSSYWPLAWPAPEDARLTLHATSSSLTLPVRPPEPNMDAAIAFQPVESALPAAQQTVRPPRMRWNVNHDFGSLENVVEVIEDNGVVRFEDTGLCMGYGQSEWYRFTANDYGTVTAETATDWLLERDSWRVRTKTHTLVTATPGEFRIRAELDAWEEKTRVFSRSWDTRIRRDCL